MRVPHLVSFYFLRGVYIHSRVAEACLVTADLIMRVNEKVGSDYKQ